jgi:hypothetical protein
MATLPPRAGAVKRKRTVLDVLVAYLIEWWRQQEIEDTRRRYPGLTAGLDDDEVLTLNGWLWNPPR